MSTEQHTQAGQSEDGQKDRYVYQSIAQIAPNAGIIFSDHIVDVSAPTRPDLAITFGQSKLGEGAAARWMLTASAGVHPSDPMLCSATLMALRGVWLPFPLLRIEGMRPGGTVRFADGPTNWARLYLDDAEPEGSGRLRATIAIDTTLLPEDHMLAGQNAAPINADADMASLFAVPRQIEDLSAFAAEVWVQDWIAWAAGRAVDGLDGFSHLETELRPMAAYLCGLVTLARRLELPSVRFAPQRRAGAPSPVDLVLDIGANLTGAMLVGCDAETGRPDLRRCRFLPIRNPAHPGTIEERPFSSQFTFANCQMGNEVLARRSGRSTSFVWPSLGRIGGAPASSAHRIASAAREPLALAFDKQPRSELREPSALAARGAEGTGQLFGGPMLLHLDSANETPRPNRMMQSVPYRRELTTSELRRLYLAEIVAQALAAINEPAPSEPRPRSLRRIVLCLPLDLREAERNAFLRDIEEATAVVWRSLGWSLDGSGKGSPAPQVGQGLDPSIAVQVAYLFDEITVRLDGDSRWYFANVGRTRLQFDPAPSVRIATLDIGSQLSRVTIGTYVTDVEGRIVPVSMDSQTFEGGSERMLSALASRVVDSRLVGPLHDIGIGGPHQDGGAIPDPAAKAAQLSHQIAHGLLTMRGALADPRARRYRRIKVGDLLAASGVTPRQILQDPICAERVGEIALSIDCHDVADCIRGSLGALLDDVCRFLGDKNCDLIALSGQMAGLPDVREHLCSVRPELATRLVPLAERTWEEWVAPRLTDDSRSRDRVATMLGAIIASGGRYDMLEFPIAARDFDAMRGGGEAAAEAVQVRSSAV